MHGGEAQRQPRPGSRRQLIVFVIQQVATPAQGDTTNLRASVCGREASSFSLPLPILISCCSSSHLPSIKQVKVMRLCSFIWVKCR